MKSFKALALVLTTVGLAVVGIVFVQNLPSDLSQDRMPTLTPAIPELSTKNSDGFEADPSQISPAWPESLTLEDQQGAVSVEITPINLNNPSETLYFEIALNTHSVDLSMDLAAMAVLQTENGLHLVGDAWDAPLGGHHVTGLLSFVISDDNYYLLQEAQELSLVIFGLDVPERIFVWHK